MCRNSAIGTKRNGHHKEVAVTGFIVWYFIYSAYKVYIVERVDTSCREPFWGLPVGQRVYVWCLGVGVWVHPSRLMVPSQLHLDKKWN